MRIYALGSNGSGQLGIRSLQDVSKPTTCQFPPANDETSFRTQFPGLPAKIVAGGSMTYILSNTGKIYQAGQSSASPPKVNEDPQIFQVILSDPSQDFVFKSISATWEAAFFVTAEDVVYLVGSGSKGELGMGEDLVIAEQGTRMARFLPEGETVVDISSSVSHTVVVSSSGDAYGWGNGRKGQLGEPASIVWLPRKFHDIGIKIVRAVCGREFTCLVGETQSGQHMILGSDKWNIKSEAPSTLQDWREVGASWHSLFMLDSAGAITSWGRNDHGQLAPKNLPLVMKMAIGSEHVLVLTMDGEVLSWGWGEHGNCGTVVDEDGDVKGEWTLIPSADFDASARIEGVGAGCATSFILTGLHPGKE